MKKANPIKPMILASRIFLQSATCMVGMLAVAQLLLIGATETSAQTPTPLYSWTFDGGSGTGVPAVTAGGGTLSTLLGTGSFTGAGLSGAATDFAYKGNGVNDGTRSAADISGLGTIGKLTVTFWINSAVVYGSGGQANQANGAARLLMLGNATTYDESAGNASPGFSIALNGGTGLQYNINNGTQPVQAGTFTPYAANQWVFVALEYDGASSNAFFSAAMGTAVGNTSRNMALLLGTLATSVGSPTMLTMTRSDNTTSPGSIVTTSTMALLVGNRNSQGRGFQGMIDNINIYTNLLTTNQLEAVRLSSLPSVLTVGTPISSVANPVPQGTSIILTPAVIGGTAPYHYQWQTDGGSGGTLTNIPGAIFATFTNNTAVSSLGNFQYQVVVTDSASPTPAMLTSAPLTVNVIQIISGSLTATDTNTAPTVNASDAAQLITAGTFITAGGINYYTDNANPVGQTFTTGSNSKGYSLSSVAIELAGGSTNATTTLQGYDLYVYSISSDTLTATLIADVTNLNFSFVYPAWVQWNLATPLILTNNATYAYTFHRRTTSWAGLSTSTGGDAYPGGALVSIPINGGAVNYGNTAGLDGTFVVGLIPNGVPFILTAVSATPNPVYALTSVKLACKPTTAGIFTYKWLTDDGSGAVPPNYVTIAGANATNLTVIPKDMNPGGVDYTTNYYFVATDTTSGESVTSSVATLTVHAASVPQLSGLNPANLVTFAGGTQTYSVTEVGTLPITNQWQFNNGGGFIGLTAQTNTTLTLSNLQTTNSGTYQIAAANLIGNSSNAVSITVLPVPNAPNPTTQKYFNAVYTNNPWAYWRLNETNDPTAGGAPTYKAYDYSGHGLFPTYGNAVTVNNAGPQTPTFPGFDANELAAGTTISTANSYLTPPSLNLVGRSNVTFIAWINPGGPQAASVGLLYNRNGGDAAGFGFCGVTDHLGYTWNNNSASTYNWDSGLAVADNEWNFVAYVITPTNATLYLGNLNGGTTNFVQAINAIPHVSEAFSGGTIRLGGDSQSLNRSFNGLISEAALFTNALSTAQVQQYFLTALGAASLQPTVQATAVSPTAASGTGVYSGQNVRLSANVSGTGPLSLKWQSSVNGTTWIDVAGGTNTTLLINPFNLGTFYYQLTATNVAGATTNNSVTVTFNPLPVYPAGVWTANFQETNNIGAGQNVGGGVGHYVGRGVIGNGMYWNVLPHVLAGGAGFTANTITNVTDFLDDGVTHSGIRCQFGNGGSYNSLGGSLPYSSDIGNLLEQFYRTYFSPNALQLSAVADGTYNLVCYGGNGKASQGASNLGTTFVAHSANGDLTASTAESTHTTDALAEGVNFVTFTNVHVTGGTLNVDVNANLAADPNASACIEGAQLQLISYDVPAANFSGTPTNIFVGQAVAFTNTSTGTITRSLWSFGDGASVTNFSTAGVSHSYTGVGTYTVSLAVSGPGGANTGIRTGYIVVSPRPTIANATTSGGSFILSGSNGPAGLQYRILTSTNAASPLASWTPVWTNVFAADGSYGYTNSSTTNAARFFILVSP